MLNCMENPLVPQSGLAVRVPLKNSLNSRAPRRRSRVRVWSSSPSTPPFPSQRVTVKDGQRASPGAEQVQRIGSTARSKTTATRAASISNLAIPIFPNDGQDGYLKKSQNGAATSRSPRIEVSAKGKWQKQHDSSLSDDEPLPLPMTWPGAAPASKETVDDMLSCDPEEQDCKTPIYQWTGDCRTCRGTGLVSFYRKRREVVSKCINCLGIGSVHKITLRPEVEDMDGTKGDSNGSARRSPGSNGSAWGSTGTNGKS